MRQKVLRLNSGSVQPMITQASMKELELPIPSVEDQRLFSAAISNLLNQRRLAEAELDQKNRLFKALLQQAFNGELT
jgi:restriction endonuclease S subunit